MPAKSAHEAARGKVILAISRLERAGGKPLHPGAIGHLKAAKVQLDAVCALLAEPTAI